MHSVVHVEKDIIYLGEFSAIHFTRIRAIINIEQKPMLDNNVLVS